MSRIRSDFEHVVRTSADRVPLPGGGDTWARFEALSKWAAQDLSLGRLVEGHSDARAILAEAGSPPAAPGATYGVWAARSPRQGTTAPCARLSVRSGMTRSRSKRVTVPRPVQVGQAP